MEIRKEKESERATRGKKKRLSMNEEDIDFGKGREKKGGREFIG